MVNSRLSTLSCLSTLIFASCSQPVVRSEAPPPVPVIPNPLGTPQINPSDLKKQIWVLPFNMMANVKGELLRFPIQTMLENQMLQVLGGETSPYVMPSAEDKAAIAEMDFDSNSDPRAVAKLARGSGSAGFIRGEITQVQLQENISPEGLLRTKTFNLHMAVNWEFYDAITGRRLGHGKEFHNFSETRSDVFNENGSLPELDQKVTQLANELSKKILLSTAPYAERLGWFGRIVRFESARVYINAGRRTGIQIGETLKVIESPRDVVDPQSGGYIGQAPGRLKGTLKVVQHFGLDGAIAVIQSGGGISIGDRVELY